MPFKPVAAALSAVLLTASPPVLAQTSPRSAPMAAPLPPPLPAPMDQPYPGTITLDVDATDVVRGLIKVTERIPVSEDAGELTVLLPQWLPGNHAPRGTLAELVDLRFTAGARPLTWRRDPVEVFAFHVALPPGTREVTATFVHSAPRQSSEGRVTVSAALMNLQWDKLSLYPAGFYTRRIPVTVSARFPPQWRAFSALDGAKETAGADGVTVSWAPTDYETLVDSPVMAGIHARAWDLGKGVTLAAVADESKQLSLSSRGLGAYRSLVSEGLALFASRHFDHYTFLLALRDEIGGIGLEHHRSSENTMKPTALADWNGMDWGRNVLAHEFSHSWNGKFRRPEGLWTPDYRQPMRNDLLWVYEGQTQFWGWVLAARSGVQTRDMVLAQIASTAGNLEDNPGRSWRSVADTTYDPIFAARKAKPFASMARGEDYYGEGALIWLTADQIIRAGTGDRKSLDDFAQGFFGTRDGDWGTVTYTFADVVAGLQAVYPYDWETFLRERIDQPGRPVPTAGLELGGYRLVWREEPNLFDQARAADGKFLSLANSLGLTVDKDGRITASRWGSPAFNAGVVSDAKIVAVNGIAYTEQVLRDAVTTAKTAPEPLRLTIQRGEKYDQVPIEYRGGLRYPWLERIPGQPVAGLDLLLEPRSRAGRL
ncbi:MAG TPA: peptidase M61 [Novosphingobium sp.]|nr:peptidase M61 [Novosphingobium sp.]